MISLRGRPRMYPVGNFAPQTKQPIQHADSFWEHIITKTRRFPCRPGGRSDGALVGRQDAIDVYEFVIGA